MLFVTLDCAKYQGLSREVCWKPGYFEGILSLGAQLEDSALKKWSSFKTCQQNGRKYQSSSFKLRKFS